MSEHLILIADSGSTKTDWVMVRADNGSHVAEAHTQGINPVHQSTDDISRILHDELLEQWPQTLQPTAVSFYGAGVTTAHADMMRRLLQKAFPTAGTVEAESDLLGAARALCGREEGIAAILGTGANSCLYDGTRIVANTPALGYILGDEGSGAVLGRRFMNAIFKDPSFAALRDTYLNEQQLSMSEVIRRVYREPMGNRFLATTSLFIARHTDDERIAGLVVDNFRDFFRHNVVPYGRQQLPVHCVGSMAYHYRHQLEDAARSEGFTLGRILKSPLDGLVSYHAAGRQQNVVKQEI
jgi:N-acetylglucosamine kinase-like BadF-type ATPase